MIREFLEEAQRLLRLEFHGSVREQCGVTDDGWADGRVDQIEHWTVFFERGLFKAPNVFLSFPDVGLVDNFCYLCSGYVC